MRTFVELIEKYINPELCPYSEYKGKPYYSIKYIENGEEHVGYSSYSLRVISEFLKKYFISPALEKQGRIITVTDAEGGLLASISDKDIIEENGVHVIISEE